MKLLLSIFLMFILVSSATLTNFAFAYEKENHYWLKIALALNCGFTLDEARLIGIGDFSIDEDPDTQPVRSGSDKDNAKWKWHALPTENPDVDKNEVSKGNQEIKQRQHELYDRAMNEKDTPMKLFKFGQYLHYQEDKWSHWGYTTGMGHAVPNVVPGMDSPDETHANPEHYRYMVFDSMVNLGKLAKSLGKDTECVSALVPLDTYKSAPEYGKDFPWFSPQEIKRSKDPLKFQKDVSKHLSDWKKSALIDEVITVSDKKGDDGVTDSFISYIAKHTGKSKSDITKKYDYSHIEIDEKGNAKTIPENLVKSVKVKEEKTSKKTAGKTKSKETQSQQKMPPDQIKTIYKISSDFKILSSTLVKLNDKGLKELKSLSTDSSKAYQLTKDQKYKKFSQEVDKKIKEVQADKKLLGKLNSASKKLNEQISKNAIKQGLKKSDLDKIDKGIFADSTNLKLEPAGKGKDIDLVKTSSDDLEKFFDDTLEHNAKLLGEILTSDNKAPEQGTSNTAKPNENNPGAPPESILDDVDISGPDAGAMQRIDDLIGRIGDLKGIDVGFGHQFIGEEGDLVAYFGPASSRQFAHTDAIDALRFDWNSIAPVQKEKPRESILDEIEEPTLAEMFGGKPKTRTDDSIAGKTGLRVLKKVNNEGGGTKGAADFTYYIDLHHGILYPNREYGMPANGDLKILSGLDPGDKYFVHEELDPDYTTKYLDDCSGVIESGKVKTCIIINTYVPKSSSGSQTGTSLGGNTGQAQTGLRVLKIVNNQGGGTKGPADFTYYIDLHHLILYANTAYNMPANGDMKILSGFDPGDKYFVHEELDSNYRTSYAGDCSGMIERGKVKTCTITNTFIPKKSTGTTSSGTQVGVLTPPVTTQPTNTKPTLTIPKQITQEATSSAGATVNYSVSGQDKEDGSITPSCSYPSGYTFPIGTTTVSCTADDSDNNSISGTFTVTVRDTTPPDIPKFQPTEGVRDETGVQVFFEVTAFDLVDGSVPASCNYPSGYKFPIGTTVLTCTADDSRGNHASRSLQITVTITESGQ